ncbi:hypothetical protein WME91_33405 [Sorangium sp. So ce269]
MARANEGGARAFDPGPLVALLAGALRNLVSTIDAVPRARREDRVEQIRDLCCNAIKV